MAQDLIRECLLDMPLSNMANRPEGMIAIRRAGRPRGVPPDGRRVGAGARRADRGGAADRRPRRQDAGRRRRARSTTCCRPRRSRPRRGRRLGRGRASSRHAAAREPPARRARSPARRRRTRAPSSIGGGASSEPNGRSRNTSSSIAAALCGPREEVALGERDAAVAHRLQLRARLDALRDARQAEAARELRRPGAAPDDGSRERSSARSERSSLIIETGTRSSARLRRRVRRPRGRGPARRRASASAVAARRR